ncbi:MAG: YciI family protein [Hyphomonadaceae bacterium]|nr:YciI family protein [Hyphomonadaceae bacterium]
MPMRYMYLISSPPNAGPPPQRLMEEIAKLSQSPGAATMIESGGLAPPGKAARIELKRGKLNVIDGPFTEAKEVIGGYAIFEFETEAEAIESARQFMEVHRLYGEGWEGTCEMRAMYSGPPPGCPM